MDSPGSEWGTVAWSYIEIISSSDSIKGRKFFDQIIGYQLVKQHRFMKLSLIGSGNETDNQNIHDTNLKNGMFPQRH
jgi:hypothetical protein